MGAATTKLVKSGWAGVAAVAVLVGALASATAQAAPPCAAGATAPATWTAQDFESGRDDTLFATHTLLVNLDLSSGPVLVDDDTTRITGPPGVTVLDSRGKDTHHLDLTTEKVAVESDTPGPLALTASWDQEDGLGTGTCTGTASTTFQLQPASPLRLSKLRKRTFFGESWTWDTSLGPQTDRRPVLVTLRSVAKAKFPGASAKARTATLDPHGNPQFEPRERHLRTPRFFLSAFADKDGIQLRGKARIFSVRERPLGFDLQLTQGGRQVARVRAAGKCGVLGCVWKKLKLTR